MNAAASRGALEGHLGGPRPWQIWYEAHRPALRRYLARSLGSDHALVEDFLQDVYLRALTAPSAVPGGEDDPRPWLFRIATNLLIDHYRRAARRPAGAGSSPEDEPDPSDNPEDEAIRQDLRRRLRDAIARLPEAQRNVFLLREYGDVPFREIALRTEAPLGTVLARMRYALIRLKAEMDASALPELGARNDAPGVAGPIGPRRARPTRHGAFPRSTRSDS